MDGRRPYLPYLPIQLVLYFAQLDVLVLFDAVVIEYDCVSFPDGFVDVEGWVGAPVLYFVGNRQFDGWYAAFHQLVHVLTHHPPHHHLLTNLKLTMFIMLGSVSIMIVLIVLIVNRVNMVLVDEC